MVREFDLTGKVALVTGAGRGIGAGVAEVLAEAGCKVAVNALTDRYVGALTTSIGERTGREAVAVMGDVTDPDSVARVVTETTERLGPIDVLVNGLGDAIRGPLVKMPTPDAPEAITGEDIDQVLAINLLSTLHCTRAVAGQMLERGGGSIINISGIAAIQGRPEQAIYAAAKSALSGLTRTLAREWAPFGVRVNAIAPGTFPDPVTSGEKRYAEQQEAGRKRVPLGRVGLPREVGLLALYLASDAGAYMTGQVVSLDGGMSA